MSLGMNLEQAVERAVREPSLADALAWIAVWECDRAVQQALSAERGNNTAGNGGTYETAFKLCFERVTQTWYRGK